MSRTDVLRLTAFVALIAVYIAARIWGLTATCLWFDEIFSVHAAEHSWNDIWRFVALDLIHPPVFYLLLKAWIAVCGESLWSLRSLPVLISIVAIIPFLLLCKEFKFDRWKTIFAFLLIASNGPLIKYSQEVRMYSLLMCISLFSLWLFTRYIRTGKGIAALAVINILLVYSHYFGWFVVASECAGLLIFQRSKWRAMFSLAGIPALAFLPWLAAVMNAASSGADVSQNIGWMNRPGIVDIFTLFLGLVEPFYFKAISIEQISFFYISIPLLLIALASIAISLSNFRFSFGEDKRHLLLIFALVPIFCAFCLSWILPNSIWGSRHLIVIFVPFAMLFASSVFESAKLKSIMVAGVIVLIIGAFAFQLGRRKADAIWCGFEPLTRELESTRPVPVVVFEDLAAYHIWFALRNDPVETRPPVIKLTDFSGTNEDKAYFLPRGSDDVQVIESKAVLPDEVVAIYRTGKSDDHETPLPEFERRGYQLVDNQTIDFGYQRLKAARLKIGKPNL